MISGPVDVLWVMLASLGFAALPILLAMTTCYTKVAIVLVLLRNALGVQQAPSNIALSGITLAITGLVMAPVFMQIGQVLDVEAILAGTQPAPPFADALSAIRGPIEAFMMKHVEPAELDALRTTLGEPPGGDEPPRPSLLVLSFVISEVSAGFKIGMYLALGFAVVDLIVANLLMAMGMTMFPPTTLATPLKLMVFVSTAAFSRTVRGLIESYVG